jgi:signal peptidase
VAKALKNIALVAVCLALVVPAVLLYTGVLPYRIYIIHTGSMIPTIPPRSAVVVRDGVYHVGQVISFESVNGIVTHRLIHREADGMLITKGDANRTADPGQTAPSHVIGGVVLAPRELGYWLVYLKNPAGAASILLTIACVWLIFSIMSDLAERQQAGETAKTAATDGAAPAGDVSSPGQGVERSPTASGPTPRPALVLDTEPPRLVWRAVPKEPLTFQCSHCEALFRSTDELRCHGAEHGHGNGGEELTVHLPTYLRRPSVVWSTPLGGRTFN